MEGKVGDGRGSRRRRSPKRLRKKRKEKYRTKTRRVLERVRTGGRPV